MSQPPTPSGFKAFIQKFTGLRSAPRELWIIYIAYIFENLAYKVGAAGVIVLWLTDDVFGANYPGIDVKAATIYAFWSAIMTLITVMIGPLTDAMGIRKTFIVGFWVCLVSRIVMTVTVEKWIVLPWGLFLQAAGIALLIPVMAAGCKRYTNASQRSVAFSLYYALMNLGYAIGDGIFDRLRGKNGLGEHGSWTVPGLDMTLSTYQVLILLSVVFTVPGLLLVWFGMREGVEMTESGVRILPPKPNPNAGLGPLVSMYRSTRATITETVRIFSALLPQRAFHRFLIFMTLVVGVKMIFYHLVVTFPKFGIRELGAGAPFAHLSGMLNSMMIVVLVPLCGALTQKVSAYRMVTFGSLISALSVFFIALPAHWFQPLADGWLGDLLVHRWLGVEGPVNPYWISIFLFIVMLSIGEAFWSPRLYEYAAAIAPKGQEASYMALSLLPYFVAKFTVGMSSGWLLKWFCPADGPRNSGTMWLIIGCMALITPVGTFLFRKHLQLQESGREPVISKTEEAAKEEEAGHG